MSGTVDFGKIEALVTPLTAPLPTSQDAATAFRLNWFGAREKAHESSASHFCLTVILTHADLEQMIGRLT
jgi:hypothetical protein